WPDSRDPASSTPIGLARESLRPGYRFVFVVGNPAASGGIPSLRAIDPQLPPRLRDATASASPPRRHGYRPPAPRTLACAMSISYVLAMTRCHPPCAAL